VFGDLIIINICQGVSLIEVNWRIGGYWRDAVAYLTDRC
jgi:hypothetical protein